MSTSGQNQREVRRAGLKFTTRELSYISGVPVGTLNAWIQRGLIPGITANARGRLREFDEKPVIDILMMAELVRIGWGAPLASRIISKWDVHNYLIMANTYEARAIWALPIDLSHDVELVGAESEADVPNALKQFPGGPPGIYTIVNVKQMKEQVMLCLHQYLQWVNAGKPANWLLNPFPSSPAEYFVVRPEEAEKSPEPAPAPSKPPARRQRRKTR